LSRLGRPLRQFFRPQIKRRFDGYAEFSVISIDFSIPHCKLSGIRSCAAGQVLAIYVRRVKNVNETLYLRRQTGRRQRRL